MNSISVAQMASWQFDERIRKEMLHQDKSRYSAAEDDTHRLVILFFFFPTMLPLDNFFSDF